GTLATISSGGLMLFGLLTRAYNPLKPTMLYKVSIVDIIFLVLWAFTLPILVLMIPDDAPSLVVFKLLIVICASNL
ncbi:hypothetical protein V1514DRAFT_285460, partial [Lipomyces japonicus]|uniref:uncharacterized protein n=1 Tax=Lipomyces japonicus TaxID=56871 RepID=UPI0034CE797C